jgi:homoserine O-acetyltransferase/O-succinyltransferase
MVDAIGDGISCSASNSLDQHGTAFPAFSVADMVTAEHRLVVEKLHLRHLRAVVGISMGGIQAFQWLLSYPELMDRVVPIVGTPQPTAYDLLFWYALTMASENDPDWRGGNYTKNPTLALVRLLVELNLSTPEFRVEHTSRAEFSKYRGDAEHGDSDDFDANDRYQ